MTLRSHFFALLVLSFLSWNASAQVQDVRPAKGPTQAVSYGSFERTKLLQKGRNTSENVLRLGAVDRRALLTTGKSVYKKKPERRYHH
jgi:hypothetical protein